MTWRLTSRSNQSDNSEATTVLYPIEPKPKNQTSHVDDHIPIKPDQGDGSQSECVQGEVSRETSQENENKCESISPKPAIKQEQLTFAPINEDAWTSTEEMTTLLTSNMDAIYLDRYLLEDESMTSMTGTVSDTTAITTQNTYKNAILSTAKIKTGNANTITLNFTSILTRNMTVSLPKKQRTTADRETIDNWTDNNVTDAVYIATTLFPNSSHRGQVIFDDDEEMGLSQLNTENISEISLVKDTSDEWFLKTIGFIRWFYLPIILIGTVANIINLVVFSRPYMRRLSTIVYLSALAIGDIINLYFELFRYWLEWMDWLIPPEHYFSDTYCKYGNYLGNASRDLTNWVVAIVTIERIVVLAFPLRAKSSCTPRTARIIVCILAISVLVAHVPSLIITKAVNRVKWVCWAKSDSKLLEVLVTIVFYFFGNIVIALVFVLNMTLIFLLYRARQLQPKKTPNSNVSNRNSHGKRLTGMLLSVGIMFIACELPRLMVLSLYNVYGGIWSLRIAMSLAFLLSGINHTANFFIYVLSGERFRRVFMNTVRCYSPSEDNKTNSISMRKLNTYKRSMDSAIQSNSVYTIDSEVGRQDTTLSSQTP